MTTFQISRTSNWGYNPPCDGCYESQKRYNNPDARDWLKDMEWEDIPKWMDEIESDHLVLTRHPDKTLELEIYDTWRE